MEGIIVALMLSFALTMWLRGLKKEKHSPSIFLYSKK